MSRASRILSPMPAMSRLFTLIFLLVLGTQLAHAERKTTYYHTDVLGSVVAASGENGALLWRKDYAPFGQQVGVTQGSGNLSYTGKQHDDSLGLTYFGARYYDPYLGRFAGVDPVGFDETNPTSFNRYAYVNNNPYRFIDPDGLEKIDPQDARKKYAVGKGHHWVPFATFDKDLDLSSEAREVFGKATSGEPLPDQVHKWDKDHKNYNRAVKDEFTDYLKRNRINPSKMTAKQAQNFVERVQSSSNSDIKLLRNRINAFHGLPPGSKKLFKAVAAVGGGSLVEAMLPSPMHAPQCQVADLDGC